MCVCIHTYIHTHIRIHTYSYSCASMYTLGPRRRRAADRRLRAEAAAALGAARRRRRRRGRGGGESERAHAVTRGRRHKRVCRRGSERAVGGAGRVLAARRSARSHTEHSSETKAVQPFLSFALVDFVEFKLVIWGGCKGGAPTSRTSRTAFCSSRRSWSRRRSRSTRSSSSSASARVEIDRDLYVRVCLHRCIPVQVCTYIYRYMDYVDVVCACMHP
jgi:hypothetical protein